MGGSLGGFRAGLEGIRFGVGFGFGLGAGGEDAAADVAFEAVGLGDGATGLDEARGGVGCGDWLVGC